MKTGSSLKTAVIASMLVVAGMFATPGIGQASTAADYPVTDFRVPYGASLLTGSITWHYRDVRITGELKARSSAKQARFHGVSSNCISPLETRTAAVDEVRPYLVEMDCDYPGGFTTVYVDLYEGTTFRAGAICTRQGCVND
jgi:hypothetical protein